MPTTASCGHTLKEGEDTVAVRVGGESCDAIDGYAASVSYYSFCPACAADAKGWDTFLKDEAATDWWFADGYRQWRARVMAEQQ